MNKFEQATEIENKNCENKENPARDMQHISDLMHNKHFFDFLNNLKSENPWEEKDFDLVFMYL